jgi:hypothetical protein
MYVARLVVFNSGVAWHFGAVVCCALPWLHMGSRRHSIQERLCVTAKRLVSLKVPCVSWQHMQWHLFFSADVSPHSPMYVVVVDHDVGVAPVGSQSECGCAAVPCDVCGYIGALTTCTSLSD